MMFETTHARASAWPGRKPSSSPRRTRKRRDSKVVYHANNARCSPPRNVRPWSASASAAHAKYTFENVDLPLRTTDLAPGTQAGLEYFTPSNNGNGSFGYSPIIHQGNGGAGQVESGNSWQQQQQNTSSLVSYTLANTNGSSSPPQFFDSIANGTSPQNIFLHISGNAPWNGGSNANSELEDLSMLNIPYGNYDDSMGLSSPTTAGTTSSDGFVFPVIDTALGSPNGAGQLFDLDLSDEYFGIGQPSGGVPDSNSPLYDENFIFDEGLQVPLDISFGSMYTSTGSQWSATTLTQPKQASTSPIESSLMSNTPWTPQPLQVSKFQMGINAGNGGFEPPRGSPYDTCKAREQYLEAGPSSQGSVGTDALTPVVDSDSESWVMTSTRSNYTPSHSSPRSQGSPPSHASPPRQHSHVFSSHPSTNKGKITKGRQRGLTQLEKKQAREVRDAKACWACHISKTKCSPCSPGSPCEQCARLVGKRRFCKFTCFNDPLESLYIFLVPVYLNGHLNKTDVEAFIAKNTDSWGTKQMLIRMDWGYRKLLEAEVVPLRLKKNAPDLGTYSDTAQMGTTPDGKPIHVGPDGKAIIVRRQSPPLGIPLDAMDDMQDVYSRYVQDIVQSDLKQYVPAAYFPEDSILMTRLLGLICDFFSAGLEADEECVLLGKALEMHITTSIVERTLSLDAESIKRVQIQLRQRYPEDATARCAQRQIKSALFLGQQRRINKVLKDWGNMMWTIHNTASNDKKWAISFCVFLILTMTTDKIFAQTYYFCEGRIQNYGAEPRSERAKCYEQLHLTEQELFARCKEIFHWKFKTRKGGKEACNPIRDGMEAFRGRPVDSAIRNLTFGLQAVVRDYASEIRSHCSVRPEYSAGMGQSPYMDVGRLSCIFLDDFLDH